jgi:NADH dehydrogenase
VLRREFDKGHQIRARVVLVEALDTLLLPYPKSLQRAAKRQLESLGVEVILGKAVEHVGGDHVRLKDGQEIRTHTLVWAAGVKGSPLAETVGVELQRGGRLPVERTLRVIGLDKVYAIGDIAWLTDAKGSPYPQVIPVAQQQGILAARNILNRIRHEPEKFFRYRDKGIMATIGRRRAVAWPFYTVKLTGFVAWITWLALHLVWLLGFRNRLNVLVNWVWNYLTYDRSVRIIVERDFAARDRYDVPAAIEQRREPALEADGIVP